MMDCVPSEDLRNLYEPQPRHGGQDDSQDSGEGKAAGDKVKSFFFFKSFK
jgi:hypothetical protein